MEVNLVKKFHTTVWKDLSQANYYAFQTAQKLLAVLHIILVFLLGLEWLHSIEVKDAEVLLLLIQNIAIFEAIQLT